MKRLVIATRRSRLALWQAEHVKQRLEALHAGLAVELLPLSTRGDELIETRLDEVGGKGLFVKELEAAMADGRADFAVHSVKDVPAQLPPGYVLAAITAREDPRDAFVSSKFSNPKEMPQGSIVGTSSLRREAQLAALNPGLEVRLLRGNVETRIAKLDRGEYDAIILAVAGLARLGLEARIRAKLAPEDVLPAPGQGALGIECLAGRPEVPGILAGLADEATSLCVRAERAVSLALGGDCTIPLGAYAQIINAASPSGARLRLRAIVAAPDGRSSARADCEGASSQPEVLGRRAAEELRSRGAVQILASIGK
jgi:hydroxymethylbilane synthase